jgi:uncharacterized membrane protein
MSNGGSSKLGVAPNVGGTLCYAPCCIGLVVSIVAVIVEKENRFVRFHALQSLAFHGALLVLGIGFWVLGLVLGALAGPLALVMVPVQMLLGLGLLVVMILLMVKAYNNEEYRLPVIGDMAAGWL